MQVERRKFNIKHSIIREQHNREINLKGSLYGDYGRWPTEFGKGGGSDGGSTMRMCSFAEREGTETVTTKLRLVE